MIASTRVRQGGAVGGPTVRKSGAVGRESGERMTKRGRVGQRFLWGRSGRAAQRVAIRFGGDMAEPDERGERCGDTRFGLEPLRIAVRDLGAEPLIYCSKDPCGDAARKNAASAAVA